MDLAHQAVAKTDREILSLKLEICSPLRSDAQREATRNGWMMELVPDGPAALGKRLRGPGDRRGDGGDASCSSVLAAVVGASDGLATLEVRVSMRETRRLQGSGSSDQATQQPQPPLPASLISAFDEAVVSVIRSLMVL